MRRADSFEFADTQQIALALPHYVLLQGKLLVVNQTHCCTGVLVALQEKCLLSHSQAFCSVSSSVQHSYKQ